MKLNKKIIIPILFFSTLSVLSFGIIKKVVFKTKTEIVIKKSREIKTNDLKSKKDIYVNPQEAILGVWFRENDLTDKLEFTSNGHEKRYFDNILQYDDFYSISNECGGNSSQTDLLYLITIDSEDSSENCETIMNGVYEPNSTTLTLLDDNGRLVIYHRQ